MWIDRHFNAMYINTVIENDSDVTDNYLSSKGFRSDSRDSQ